MDGCVQVVAAEETVEENRKDGRAEPLEAADAETGKDVLDSHSWIMEKLSKEQRYARCCAAVPNLEDLMPPGAAEMMKKTALLNGVCTLSANALLSVTLRVTDSLACACLPLGTDTHVCLPASAIRFFWRTTIPQLSMQRQ